LIKRGLKYNDVISAELDAYVKLIVKRLERKLFVSVNGSDDEINAYDKRIGNQFNREREDITSSGYILS